MKITYNLRKSFTVDMRTEVFIRQLQCKVETFLARKGTKSHISLSQNISNITFGKVQTVSLTLYLPEIQKLIRQVQQPFRMPPKGRIRTDRFPASADKAAEAGNPKHHRFVPSGYMHFFKNSCRFSAVKGCNPFFI